MRCCDICLNLSDSVKAVPSEQSTDIDMCIEHARQWQAAIKTLAKMWQATAVDTKLLEKLLPQPIKE